MIIARVTGTVYATRQHRQLDGQRILITQPIELPSMSLLDSAQPLLAIDAVQAGIGDHVIINKEGSGARLILDNEELPVQAVIVAVIDDFNIRLENKNS